MHEDFTEFVVAGSTLWISVRVDALGKEICVKEHKWLVISSRRINMRNCFIAIPRTSASNRPMGLCLKDKTPQARGSYSDCQQIWTLVPEDIRAEDRQLPNQGAKFNHSADIKKIGENIEKHTSISPLPNAANTISPPLEQGMVVGVHLPISTQTGQHDEHRIRVALNELKGVVISPHGGLIVKCVVVTSNDFLGEKNVKNQNILPLATLVPLISHPDLFRKSVPIVTDPENEEEKFVPVPSILLTVDLNVRRVTLGSTLWKVTPDTLTWILAEFKKNLDIQTQ